MGKGTLLIVAAALIGSTTLFYQSQKTSMKANEAQSEQDAKVIAREIARSAFNRATSRARKMDHDGATINQIVEELGEGVENGVKGEAEGGHYTYWANSVAGSSYRIGARGTFGNQSYKINNGKSILDGMLHVPEGYCSEGCTLNVSFEQSQAGYCSAIYVQRTLADTPADEQPDPELIFAPGHDRNGARSDYQQVLQPGTQMNFLLAVNQSCSLQGETVAADNDDYDYTRRALEMNAEDLTDMQETDWAILEEDGNREGRWRIAFEDRSADYRHNGMKPFEEEYREDIKENGYPDRDGDGLIEGPNGSTAHSGDVDNNPGGYNWDGSWGGSGSFLKREDGFRKLFDYGSMPDFSDQVFYVKLTPTSGGGTTEPAD